MGEKVRGQILFITLLGVIGFTIGSLGLAILSIILSVTGLLVP